MKSVTLNVPTELAKDFAAEMAALCKKYEVETDGLKSLLPVTERIKTFEDARRELGENQWKPSDEQMECLLSEVNAWTKGCPKQRTLESLYHDLKKLKD